MMATSLKAAINDTAPLGDAPQPLRREMRAADRYPVEELGPVLGDAVTAAANIIGAPLELCAQSALANAALAVQGQADVIRPWGSEKPGPISLFLMSVAESGDRKTTADNALGGDAIADHEAMLEVDYSSDRRRYEAEREGYDIARQAIKAQASKEKLSAPDIAERLNDMGAEPEPPLSPSLTFGDPTVEGLHKHFAYGQPSAGLFSTEGGAFVGGVGMNPENALKTSAQLSELWDGAPIKRLRAGDGATVLRNRRLSFHLMMQPGAAHQWLSNPVIRDQGLFSRLLVAAPKSLAGTRLHKETNPSDSAKLDAYRRHLSALLSHPLPVDPERRGELQPRPVGLTATAKELVFQFSDSIEVQLGAEGQLAAVKGLAAKTVDHAIRIAAVIGLFERLDLPAIDRPLMARGITLAQWYLGEALRLTEAEAFPPDLLNAEKLLAWLQAHKPDELFSLPCVYTRGPNPVRSKDTANRAVVILKDHLWIEEVPGRHRIANDWRSQCFRLRSAA